MTGKFSMSEFSNSIIKNQHFFINMKLWIQRWNVFLLIQPP